jgi:hypothetical protein
VIGRYRSINYTRSLEYAIQKENEYVPPPEEEWDDEDDEEDEEGDEEGEEEGGDGDKDDDE